MRESVVKKIGQDQSQQALSKVVRGKMMGGKTVSGGGKEKEQHGETE